MAKWVAPSVLDEALMRIAGAGRILATSGQPVDYAGAVSGRLAEATLVSGDFALEPAGGGRRIVIGAKPDVVVAAAGSADHVALVDDGSATLLYVTTCPPQTLLPGGLVNFDSWTVEIGEPA